MHSPLPDSSALEAGIIEDSRPSRLSLVQDNVRNLLRSSVFGSVHSSPVATPTRELPLHEPVIAPLRSPVLPETQVEILPSPTETPSTATAPSTLADSPQVPGVLFPPVSYHQSTLFNTRAVAALDHPDLSDPSLAVFLQQKTEKRQQRAWKRRRSRRAVSRRGDTQWIVCFILGFVLAGLIGTYLAIATTSTSVQPALHILFILSILLTAIVFIHSMVRLFFSRRHSKKRAVLVLSVSHQGQRHRRRHPAREMPTQPDHHESFVPAVPIPVSVAADEVRPDSSEAQPSAAVHQTPDVWDKHAEVPNPPPAYGKWRGSVRADPELLHWQVFPSPTASTVPSPTYEELPQQPNVGAPPSYRTRDSPARSRGLRDADPLEHLEGPEMIEVRERGSAD